MIVSHIGIRFSIQTKIFETRGSWTQNTNTFVLSEINNLFSCFQSVIWIIIADCCGRKFYND